ncbi:hypothetical protein DXG01_006473 [Tephrocybe rancida]|nr:hypothetical protein DXG01_006473 [Tephrocybe rancida]
MLSTAQSDAATPNSDATQHYSAPPLMDLLNEDDISPIDININHLEVEWFEQLYPNRIRMILQSQITQMQQILTVTGFSDAAQGGSGNTSVGIVGGQVGTSSTALVGPTRKPDDWDMSEFIQYSQYRYILYIIETALRAEESRME